VLSFKGVLAVTHLTRQNADGALVDAEGEAFERLGVLHGGEIQFDTPSTGAPQVTIALPRMAGRSV
jgi:hypothetical protein